MDGLTIIDLRINESHLINVQMEAGNVTESISI
jgi:hypothetical protein